MTNTVLILGARGRFGRHAATAFANAGWNVRKFDRNRDDLDRAAIGADVIVAAWNPAYPDWAAQVAPLHRQVIKAAQASGSTVIVPGNVYVYGPKNDPVWGPSTPHLASNPLGRIRINMEKAYRDSGVRTILLRAGDFIDTENSGNWFDMIMAKTVGKGKFTYPGNSDIPHAWAFLPDLTKAAVALAEKRDELNTFEDIAFPGFTVTGQEITTMIGTVTGRRMRLKKLTWLPFVMLSPFWKMAKCLSEMRYLWDTPHALNGARFEALLPEFQSTPLKDALIAALPVTEVTKPQGGPVQKAMSTQTSL